MLWWLAKVALFWWYLNWGRTPFSCIVVGHLPATTTDFNNSNLSDNYRIICTVQVVKNPEIIADRVINWLQEQSIIEKELSNCVLGINDLGYKPGSGYLDSVKYDEDILRWTVCGVEVTTKRTVFNAMSFSALVEMYCPSCRRNRFEGITARDFVMDSLTEEQNELYRDVFPQFDNWTKNEEAKLSCPHCETPARIDDYEIGTGITLSNLGLTFWNWPEFKDEFVSNIKEQFGTEIKVIVGHL